MTFKRTTIMPHVRTTKTTTNSATTYDLGGLIRRPLPRDWHQIDGKHMEYSQVY